MESTNAGLDLEKELTCSICTELLYQPLTLLDCLHTFCGACLKEWFSFQAATAERSPNPPAPGTNIFTCPSCRATVRTTQHNATVVTLLDMFIAASPDKARSAAEKEEMAKKYKPGDQVLPTINTHRTTDERRADAEDRRLMDEVRELSLQEAGVSSAPPRTRRRRESRSADDRSRSSRDRERDRDRDRSLDSRHQRGSRRPRMEDGGRHSSDQLHVEGERRRRRSESRQRQIEHQSSIRSLISSADMSERDIEREIESFARQIQEEGLLDGLDLDNIDLSRDDELSRRITEAYRRRQRDRTRQETRRNNGSNYPPLTRHAENSASDSRMLAPDAGRPRERSRPHSRSTSAASAASAASQTEERSRPPTSTTSANLEVQEPARRPRRRTASGGRSSTTPVFPTTAEPRPAARSSTDLGARSQTTDPTQSRPSFSEGRSTSTPIHTVPFPNPTEAASSSNNAGGLSFANRQGTATSSSGMVAPLFSHHDPAAGRSSRPRPTDLAIVHQTVTSPISSPTVSMGHQRTRSQLFPEPSVSCSRCNKSHIEYELHYNCSICANGQWNMCLDCYRAGKGCLYWFGFGYGAWAKWEKKRQQQGDASLAKPHMLTASRYRPPRSVPGGADGRKTLTTDDPRHRLESGTFCANCSAWTNECYWRCNVCNEGDWGFCNDCVNQGRSCTHTLLPLAHEASQPTHSRSGSPPRSPGRPTAASIFKGPNASNIGPFKPLSFATRCDICQEPIQPNQARYHCYHCTSSLVSDAAPGDYDICSSCYGNLVTQRQISPENGHSGWRRCLNGHRMVIVGFTDGKIGQWRYVAQDLVGGRGLRSEQAESAEHRERGLQKWIWHQNDQNLARLVTRDVSETAPTVDGFAQSFPPDGGVGMKATARFGWFPKAGSDDELLFPRGAEIKEIEDVNGEWFFGAYMGSRGLFPAPYVRLDQNAS